MPPTGHTAFQPTCFGGLLVRTVAGWTWSDGADEPRMHDVAACDADLRTRTEGAVDDVVEVPYRLAEFFDALGWLLDGMQRGDYEVDVSTGSYPALGRTTGSSAQCAPSQRQAAGMTTGVMVVLVPLADWMRWCRDSTRLPVWAAADEFGLEQSAMARGWRVELATEHEDTRRVDG